MRVLSLLFIFLWSSYGISQQATILIKQIDVEGRRAVAETTGDFSKLHVGSELIAVIDGKDCFFSVTSISGTLLQLEGLRCIYISDLKVGQALEPSLFEESPKSEAPPIESLKDHSERVVRLALVPYYGLGTSMGSGALEYNQAGQPTTYGGGTISTNTAPGAAIEIYESPKNGFGWSTGVSYEFKRSVSGLNAYANGSFIGGSFMNPEPTLSLLAIYANLIYRLEDFYFPFGINFSFPSFQGGGNAFGNTTLTGDVGLQIGAGYILSSNIALEFWIEDLYLDGSTTTGAGTINYNGLSFIDPLVRFRFSF